jgi:hypothetical protein
MRPGESVEAETSLRHPGEDAVTRDGAAVRQPERSDNPPTVRIQIEPPAGHAPQAQGQPPAQAQTRSGPSPWLWVILTIIGLIVLVVAAAVVVGALHGISGAIQQQTGVLAGQVRALGQIDRDLQSLIQSIQQAIQALLAHA